MGRWRSGNSVKDRRNRACDGYRNVDTAKVCIVMRNDKKCVDFIKRNGNALLDMKKNDKLAAIERNCTYGLDGASKRNVDYRELNAALREIRDR